MILSYGHRPLVRLSRSCLAQDTLRLHSSSCRTLSTKVQQWQQGITDPSARLQAYISTSPDVFTNLAIEQYLFKKTPQGSRCLFLYTDSPCIVIGRNQNPWLEVNLSALKEGAELCQANEDGSKEAIQLVRRRSGGGTVFHDQGNVNWSVICDMTEFTRDKHAEMIVRALRNLGIENSRVNQRHDIVLDHIRDDLRTDHISASDTHRTSWTLDSTESSSKTGTREDIRPRKVSGSAYKLARNRALHHGTALLSSPNLGSISKLLRSPAKNFIAARGVESVSSPVTNIKIENSEFENEALDEFSKLYGAGSRLDFVPIGEELLEIEEIQKDVSKMKSMDWMYLQTPQFTLSTRPQDKDVSTESAPDVSITMRYGAITDVIIHHDQDTASAQALKEHLAGRKVHEIRDWANLLGDLNVEVPHPTDRSTIITLSIFLSMMLPKP